MVSVEREATLNTTKLSLSFAILLIAVTALGTGAGRITRINRDDRNTGHLRFVFNEPSQLIECPLAEPFTISLTNRCLEPAQVLDSNIVQGAFGLCDNSLCDNMIRAALESPLSAGEFLEVPLGGFSAFALESALEFSCLDSNGIDIRAAKRFPSGIGSQVHNTGIHSEVAGRWHQDSIRQVNHKTEKEFALAIDQIGLVQNAPLFKSSVFSERDGNFAPAINCKNRSKRERPERQQSVIVDDGGMLSEDVHVLPLRLVGFVDLADGSDRKLSRQSELVAHVSVQQTVECDLSEYAALKCRFGDVITRGIELFHCPEKRLLFVFGREQLNFNRELHCMDALYPSVLPESTRNWRLRFLPGLKSGVSAQGK